MVQTGETRRTRRSRMTGQIVVVGRGTPSPRDETGRGARGRLPEETLEPLSGDDSSVLGREFSGGVTAKRLLYPFAAIVGQEKMKLSLILNAINPEIGGVLIRGQKGSAKSVAVRGLTELLPDIRVVRNCRFRCNPDEEKELCGECRSRIANGETPLPVETTRMKVVDLPLGVTEDRVIGSINIEALLEGKRVFEQGILAEANQGILYVDEINLLDNYIVDVLLDAAAMGVNTVEREGVSVSHPAKFILVGTMNPEEGELRPQLLDRLGLAVEISGETDPELRTQIVKNVRAFNEDPSAFRAIYEDSQEWARNRIKESRNILPSVQCSDKMLELIAEICIDFAVDGHRADIIIEKTARTHAAYNLRNVVTKDDVIAAAELVLPHRMRRQPLEEEEFSYDMLAKIVEDKDI